MKLIAGTIHVHCPGCSQRVALDIEVRDVGIYNSALCPQIAVRLESTIYAAHRCEKSS